GSDIFRLRSRSCLRGIGGVIGAGRRGNDAVAAFAASSATITAITVTTSSATISTVAIPIPISGRTLPTRTVVAFAFRFQTRINSLLAGKTDFAFLVNADDLRDDFIAETADVFNFFYAARFKFADVNETFFARQNFDECAEIRDADNFT